MKLDLPSSVPLPDDVRHRALDRVLAGIGKPAPRRVTWFPALLAASVVVAVVVTTTFAVSRTAEPPTLEVAAPPATVVSPELDRCADAVDEAGRAGDYPPRAGWALTAGAAAAEGADSVVVVNDRFACLLTPVSVAVTPVTGTPMGDASLAQLGPSVLAVLNPQRRTVTVDDPDIEVVGADQPVTLWLLDGVGMPAGVSAVVEDTACSTCTPYDDPLPTPAPPLVVQEDRALPERTARDADSIDLDGCLTAAPGWANSRPEFWIPAGRHDDGSSAPPVLLARIDGLYAGFCVLADDGPRFTAGPLPPPAGEPPPQIVAVDPGNDALTSVLLTVPGGTVRGEIDSRPPPDSEAGGQGSSCTIVDGLMFCATGGPRGSHTVYMFGSDGVATHELRI